MKLPLKFLILFVICFFFVRCERQSDENQITETSGSSGQPYDHDHWSKIKSLEELEEVQNTFFEKYGDNEELVGLHKQLTLGAFYLNKQDYPQAIEVIQNALLMYDESVSSELTFLGLIYLIECFVKLEDTKKLSLPITQLEIMSNRINDPELIVKYYAAMGLANTSTHQNDKSLEYFYKAFDLLKDDGNHSLLITLNNSTGLALHDLRKFEEAIHYYTIALQLALKYEENQSLPMIYNNFSNSYAELGQYKKAEEYLLKSIELNEQEENDLLMIKNYYNLGRIFNDQQKYTLALDYFNRAYELSASLNFQAGLGYSLFGIGSSKFLLNRWGEAEAYFRDAEAILREIDDKPILYNTLMHLIQIERKKGNYQEALNLYDEFFELEQLYHEVAANQRSEELSIKHNVDLVRLENEILEEKNSSFEAITKLQRTYLTLLIIFIFILLLLFFIALNSKKKTQNLLVETEKQKAKIENQKEKLSQLVTERDALVKTIIHDLRNPISAIQGFSNLLSDDHSEEDRKLFIQMLSSSSNQLDVLISSLSNTYTDESDKRKVILRKMCIKELLDEIIKGFLYEFKLKKIAIRTDLEEFEALVDKNAVFTVLGNLISNALKFSPKGTEVFIQSRKKETHWELLVRDQGPGFSIADREKMFGMFTTLSAIPTNQEVSTGLGLFSVKKTLHFIGGDLQLNTQYVEGAEFICRFPLDNANK